LCLDLLWKPIGEKLRFVLVADGDERFIMMGSDLTLGARDMILAYSYRFKIEVGFKVLKHLIGAFSNDSGRLPGHESVRPTTAIFQASTTSAGSG
jgi:hypothetical protein